MDSVGLLIVSGDEAAGDPTCARSRSAPKRDRHLDVPGLAVGWADSSCRARATSSATALT